MPISEKYLKNTTTISLSYGRLQLKLSDTLGNLFDGREVDLSFLLNNGNEYELMNTGGKQNKSNTHGNPFTSSFYNWSYYDDDQSPITYLGFCLIYAENSMQYQYDAFDLTNLVTNNVAGYYSEGWSTFKNSRIILDVNNNGLNGVFLSPSVARSAYAPANPNGGTIQYSGEGESSDIWDHFTVSVKITNYHKFMLDSETLAVFESQSILPCFFYNIDGNIFATKSPLYNTYNDNWEYTIDNVKYSYTFAKITKDTNPTADLMACGRAGFMYYSNPFYYARFALTFKPLQAFYIVNSSGLRWTKYETSITTAKQFRDNVRLGKMNSSGIVTYNEWIVGEEGIQKSDNPNKDMTYDNIPERSGGGGESGDDIDDMLMGYEGYENGFIKHYQVTAGNLETISQKLAEDTTHLNAINNIVSLKSYVIPTTKFIADTESDRIIISGVDTTIDAPKITVTKSDYEIGSTTVSGKYGSAAAPHFLDFAPYTQIECYIPYCGTVQLPDWVMYKTIHVILISDIIAGSCKGIVKCNGDIVAEKVGVLGIDAPFTSEANALKNSAMLQTVLNGANIGMQTLSSGVSGNYGGIAKNTLQGLANIQQSILAGNNNYTVSVGTAPDKIEYAMPSECYIKVYSPVKEEPENYPHTAGKPLMKTKTLSEVSGFTVCSNVDTDGIAVATASERDKIKSLLETGIII